MMANMSNQQTNRNMRLSCELRKAMILRIKEAEFSRILSNKLCDKLKSTVVMRDDIVIQKSNFNESDLRLAYIKALVETIIDYNPNAFFRDCAKGYDIKELISQSVVSLSFTVRELDSIYIIII